MIVIWEEYTQNLKRWENKKGQIFVWDAPKMVSFSQLPAVKKDTIFGTCQTNIWPFWFCHGFKNLSLSWDHEENSFVLVAYYSIACFDFSLWSNMYIVRTACLWPIQLTLHISIHPKHAKFTCNATKITCNKRVNATYCLHIIVVRSGLG